MSTCLSLPDWLRILNQESGTRVLANQESEARASVRMSGNSSNHAALALGGITLQVRQYDIRL